MSALIPLTVIAAFLVLAGAVAWWWLKLQDTNRLEALQALAARRGWALTMNEAQLGRPGILRMMPRGGMAWVVETRRTEATPVQQSTEFLSEEPHFPQGTAIFGPALPADIDPATFGPLDTAQGRALAQKLLGTSLAGHAKYLALWPAPEAISVWADSNPSPRLDLSDMAKLYAAYAQEQRQQPVIVLTRDGMRLHLPTALHRADQIERFVDFALEAARIL